MGRGVGRIVGGCCALVLGLSIAPAWSQGAIQKCVDAAGKVTYQDGPCRTGKTAGVVERDTTAADPAVRRRIEADRDALAERKAGVIVTPEQRSILRNELPRYLAAVRLDDVDEQCRVARRILRELLMAKDELGYERWRRIEASDCDAAAQRLAAARAAPAAPAVPSRTDNKSRAGERRFITKGIVASEDAIRARLGSPDRTEVRDVYWVWIYDPTENDQQTRTTIWFYRGMVADVARDVVR